MDVLKTFLLVFFIPLIVISIIVAIVIAIYNQWGDIGIFFSVIVIMWALVSVRIALEINE